MASRTLFHAARGWLMSLINRIGAWYSPPDAPMFDVNAPSRRIVQFFGRMYAKAELPRHIQLLEVLQVCREPLWLKEGWRECRGSWHGYRMRLNIPDFYQRWAWFLCRYHEMPMQVLLRHALKKGDVFIDGGANNGLVTMVGAWLVGKTGQVHAFEPNTSVYNQLKWHVDTNALVQVTAHRAGLSDREEELVLQVPGSGNLGAGTFSAIPGRYGGQIAESCTAPLVLGDSLLPKLPVRPGCEVVIKLDVEGFELRAIRGLEKTIRARKPMIVMEMNAEMLGMNNVTFDDVFNHMTSRGYLCFGFVDTRVIIRRHGLELREVRRTDAKIPADVAWIHPESGVWRRLASSMIP